LLAHPLSLISIMFSALLIVEEIYNWPGIGRIFMRAITQRDLPVVQAVLMVLAVVVVVVEVLVRLLAGRFGVDPEAARSASARASDDGRPSPVAAPGLRTRAALLVAVVLIVAAIAAPLLVRFPPDQVLLDEIHNAPSFRHWMGTDSSGRDLFSRLLFAGRVSMGLAVGSAVVAVAVGLALTVDLPWTSGANGVTAWLARAITSIPILALAVTLISVVGRAPVTMGLIFAASGLGVAIGRLRALQVATRRWTFVDGARAAGARPLHIGERHLLPHLARPLIATAAGLVPGFLLLEATLGFLGYSVTPTMPSWGTLLWRAREALHRGDWWLLGFPSAFLAAASWAFLGISEALAEPAPPTHVRSARLVLGREWGRMPAAGPVLAARPARHPAPRLARHPAPQPVAPPMPRPTAPAPRPAMQASRPAVGVSRPDAASPAVGGGSNGGASA
jgi:peptide/nickel transport system permease protein